MSGDIDRIFDTFRGSPFRAPDINSTPQESGGGSGNIQPAGFIQDGVIDLPQLATQIAPVQIVSSNPSLPDTGYPVDTFIYNTTDKKLYKNVAEAWEYVINAGDITATELAANSVVAGKIAAGAVSTTELAASAVIALVTNSGATVVINASGITITNGALNIEDEFGISGALTGSGIGGSWLDQIMFGFKNARFAYGSSSDIAVSEVSGGATDADYAASLSPDLPYWVVKTSDTTLTVTADSAESSGYKLQSVSTGAQTSEIYQDVPVVPGFDYLAWVKKDATGADVYMSWRTITHGLIGSEYLIQPQDPNEQYVVYSSRDNASLGAAPANAAYLRFSYRFAHSSASTKTLSTVALERLTSRLGVYEANIGTLDTTLTTTAQTLDAQTLTIGLDRPCIARVTGIIDFDVSVASTAAAVGELEVNGTPDGQQIVWKPDSTVKGRATCERTWYVGLPSGTNTLNLTARKSTSGGAITALYGHTRLVAEILDYS